MESSSVTIGIINWNTKSLLVDILGDVSRYCNRRRFSVTVVDNGSTDGSQELVRQSFPWVNIIRNHSNLGFTKACNQVLLNADSEYVVLINTDVRLTPSTIDGLIDHMRKHQEIACCGPKLLNQDGSIQFSARKTHSVWSLLCELLLLSRLFPRSRVFDPEIADFPMDDQPHVVDYVSGALMCIRQRTIAALGGFDESYFLYVQELDFCLRAKKKDWGVIYLPKVSATHFGGETTRKISRIAAYYMHRDRYVFLAKTQGSRSAGLFSWFVLLLSLAKSLLLYPALVLGNPMVKEALLRHQYVFRRMRQFLKESHQS